MLIPGVGPADPRIGVDTSQMPWAAIGRLQIPGATRCTAVMVEPHWAATAAHCLGVRRLGHVAPPSAIHLLLGYADGRFARHLVADRVAVDPDAALAPEQHRGRDLALIHFPDSVATLLPLDRAAPGPGMTLALGGYGQDRAERLAVDPDCRALGLVADGERQGLLAHDCSGTRGTSGGAVLTRTDGTWRLAGIQVAGTPGVSGGLAVPAATVAAALAQVVP